MEGTLIPAAALALGADGINMGTLFCATVEAPFHDVPTVKELVERIVSDAEAVIRQRLMGMSAAI